jgi:flagellar biosynthesis GTPase FlhF
MEEIIKLSVQYIPTIIESLKSFFLNEKEKKNLSKENEELKRKNDDLKRKNEEIEKRNKEIEKSNKENEKKIEDLKKERQKKIKELELQRQKELDKSRNLFCFVCFIMCGMLIFFGIWFYQRNFDVEKIKIDASRIYQRNFDVVEKMKIKVRRMIKRYL